MSKDLETQKKEIKEELTKLKHEFKIVLPKVIADARAFGDLKENAEYHAARERQSYVQGKITHLSQQLSKLNNISVNDLPEDKVAFGSTVSLIDVNTNDNLEIIFVSPGEVNPSEGKISLSSPYGLALQNKTAGETIEVTIPAGKKNFYIEKLTTIHGNEFEKKYEQ